MKIKYDKIKAIDPEGIGVNSAFIVINRASDEAIEFEQFLANSAGVEIESRAIYLVKGPDYFGFYVLVDGDSMVFALSITNDKPPAYHIREHEPCKLPKGMAARPYPKKNKGKFLFKISTKVKDSVGEYLYKLLKLDEFSAAEIYAKRGLDKGVIATSTNNHVVFHVV